MEFLAASASAMDKIESVPVRTWLWLAGGIVGLILLVIVLRKVAKMNKIVLGIIIFLVCTFIGFNWLYERNEPAWATPFVEPLSKFFPSKTSMK